MSDYRDWLSLRELDEAAGTLKGTAFRCFRQRAPQWTEGLDYRVLQPDRDSDDIGVLRRAQRIYAGSVKIILLSRSASETLLQDLQPPARTPR